MKKLVRITKIKASEEAAYRSPSWDEYDLGKLNRDFSLPIDYWVEGYLLHEPEVGKPLLVERISRNGEKVYGFLRTSTIKEINDNYLKTLNSVYRIDYIK